MAPTLSHRGSAGGHRPAGLRGVVLGLTAGLCLLVPAAGAAQANPGRSAFGRSHKPVCATARPRMARCNAEVVTGATGAPRATRAPAGYGPADLGDAYGLAAISGGGAGQTVAVVDAYDDPGAEADLAVYRSRYGLPACTTANGCFAKVDQRGGTAYPAADPSWAQEISLDLDMVSAICPRCRILLVEAASNRMSDLEAAVDRAAALGATQISNSYGADEYPGEVLEESHFNHPGVAITASSGDNGYGVEFPAASRHVTAVGGTTLVRDAGAPGGWTQSAWSGAGSGCSQYIPKPAWQTDSGCVQRSVADVSAVADPATGVAVYDTYQDNGWLVFGGTSVSAPIVAAFDALLGSTAGPSYAYAHRASYLDVVAGSNGSCDLAYLCSAVAGYDGPTGLGAIRATTATTPASATTGAAGDIAAATATLDATVNPNGSAATAHFEYGTTTAYGSASAEQPVGADAADHSVSAVLGGLAPSTTYHYRIVAGADCLCLSGTTYGGDATFTTAAAPASTAPPPPAAGGGPLPTSPALPEPVTGTGGDARAAAGLAVRRAAIAAGSLQVLGTITRLADGRPATVAVSARHRTVRYTLRVTAGRLRLSRRLPAALGKVAEALVTVTYAGDARVRPARARARARRAPPV